MSDYLNKKSIINLFTVIVIFSLDRISKFYVISQSEKNLSYDLFESKFLNINLVWNEGIAFGLLSFDEKYFYNFLTILIIILIIIIFFMILKNEGFKKYSLLMILGGALGNLYDRIFLLEREGLSIYHEVDVLNYLFVNQLVNRYHYPC